MVWKICVKNKVAGESFNSICLKTTRQNFIIPGFTQTEFAEARDRNKKPEFDF